MNNPDLGIYFCYVARHGQSRSGLYLSDCHHMAGHEQPKFGHLCQIVATWQVMNNPNLAIYFCHVACHETHEQLRSGHLFLPQLWAFISSTWLAATWQAMNNPVLAIYFCHVARHGKSHEQLRSRHLFLPRGTPGGP